MFKDYIPSSSVFYSCLVCVVYKVIHALNDCEVGNSPAADLMFRNGQLEGDRLYSCVFCVYSVEFPSFRRRLCEVMSKSAPAQQRSGGQKTADINNLE